MREMGESRIESAILEFFEEKRLRYTRMAGPASTFLFTVTHALGSLTAVLRAKEKERQCLANLFLPAVVPPGKHSSVADFLRRVNGLLSSGAFELDFKTGCVIFRTVTKVNLRTTSVRFIQEFVERNAAIVRDFLPSLSLVILGSTSPKEALGIAKSCLIQEERNLRLVWHGNGFDSLLVN